MITLLNTSNPAEIETECLVVAVLDAGQGDQSQPELVSGNAALRKAAAELLCTGEVTGKIFETVMVHRPQGIKAKRLLLVGGGKAKNFTAYELRKVAGTAVRFLKPKGVRSLAIVAPDDWGGSAEKAAHSTYVSERGGPADAVKAVVEGVFVADFDPDTYKSDRKDLRTKELTVVAPAGADPKTLQSALDEARIIGEAQNFTRELVNEPGNRMTPTEMARRARQMVEEVAPDAPGLSIETYGADKLKEVKMGAFWSDAQGSDEPPPLSVIRYDPAGAPQTT